MNSTDTTSYMLINNLQLETSPVEDFINTPSHSQLTTHTQQRFPGIPRTKSLNNSIALNSILILLLILSLYLIGRHKKTYIASIRGLFSSKNRSVSYSDNNDNSNISSILLWIITILSITIFTCISTIPTDDAVKVIQNPTTVAIYIAILTTFLLLKLLGFITVGYIFDNSKNMVLYLESYFTIIGTLGIILIPLCISKIFAPPTLQHITDILGIIIITITFILVAFKSIQIFFSQYTSLLYVFLYLCTLEILPVLVVIKLVFLLR